MGKLTGSTGRRPAGTSEGAGTRIFKTDLRRRTFSIIPSCSNRRSIAKNEKVDLLEPLEIKEDKIKATKVPVLNNKPLKNPVSINSNNDNKIVSSGNFAVQVGAFSQENGALKVKSDYQKKFSNYKIDVKKVFVNGKTLFKVFIGGFANQEKAKNFRDSNGLGNAVIIAN